MRGRGCGLVPRSAPVRGVPSPWNSCTAAEVGRGFLLPAGGLFEGLKDKRRTGPDQVRLVSWCRTSRPIGDVPHVADEVCLIPWECLEGNLAEVLGTDPD
ncbi:hypothetical protein NDU88_003313 [Pleurodeles waltl]|uniref:Uncharacterized protein n=1 Tax=Pleurodeles waltl TaxID=8319 RepID=A0AAV7MT31_PLEWA|nr:hypothetical protein NDU88_003313 [Pleurodeles waltl]